MARQSIYVHGNSVVIKYPGGNGLSPHTPGNKMHNVYEGKFIEWTDIVGLHRDDGVYFSSGGGWNTFFCSIPTPTMRDNVRAKLARFAIMFSTTIGVVISGIRISDGSIPLNFPFPIMQLGGNYSTTWIQNINFFDHPNPPEINLCIGINIDVFFNDASYPGQIKFSALGCDFIV